MPEVAEQRQQWKFNSPNSMGVEHRQAAAPEYVAYYLDRIEQHLEKIAASGSQSQASSGAVAQTLPKFWPVSTSARSASLIWFQRSRIPPSRRRCSPAP